MDRRSSMERRRSAAERRSSMERTIERTRERMKQGIIRLVNVTGQQKQKDKQQQQQKQQQQENNSAVAAAASSAATANPLTPTRSLTSNMMKRRQGELPTISLLSDNGTPDSTSSMYQHPDLQVASEHLQKGRDIYDQHIQNHNPQNNDDNMNNMSNTTSCSCLQNALSEYHSAVPLLEDKLGFYHPTTAEAYYWIGFLYQQQLITQKQQQQDDDDTKQPPQQQGDPTQQSIKRKNDARLFSLAWIGFLRTWRVRLWLYQDNYLTNTYVAQARNSFADLLNWYKQQSLGHQKIDVSRIVPAYETILIRSIHYEQHGDDLMKLQHYGSATEQFQIALSFESNQAREVVMIRCGEWDSGCSLHVAMLWYKTGLALYNHHSRSGQGRQQATEIIESYRMALRVAYAAFEDVKHTTIISKIQTEIRLILMGFHNMDPVTVHKYLTAIRESIQQEVAGDQLVEDWRRCKKEQYLTPSSKQELTAYLDGARSMYQHAINKEIAVLSQSDHPLLSTLAMKLQELNCTEFATNDDDEDDDDVDDNINDNDDDQFVIFDCQSNFIDNDNITIAEESISASDKTDVVSTSFDDDHIFDIPSPSRVGKNKPSKLKNKIAWWEHQHETDSNNSKSSRNNSGIDAQQELNESYAARVDELTVQNENLSSQLQDSQHQNELLQTNLSNMTTKNDNLENEIEHLKLGLEQMTSSQQEIDQRYKDLEESHSKLATENQDLAEKLKSKEIMTKLGTRSILDYSSELSPDFTNLSLTEAQERCQILTLDNKRLQKVNESLEDMLSHLEKELQDERNARDAATDLLGTLDNSLGTQNDEYDSESNEQYQQTSQNQNDETIQGFSHTKVVLKQLEVLLKKTGSDETSSPVRVAATAKSADILSESDIVEQLQHQQQEYHDQQEEKEDQQQQQQKVDPETTTKQLVKSSSGHNLTEAQSKMNALLEQLESLQQYKSKALMQTKEKNEPLQLTESWLEETTSLLAGRVRELIIETNELRQSKARMAHQLKQMRQLGSIVTSLQKIQESQVEKLKKQNRSLRRRISKLESSLEGVEYSLAHNRSAGVLAKDDEGQLDETVRQLQALKVNVENKLDEMSQATSVQSSPLDDDNDGDDDNNGRNAQDNNLNDSEHHKQEIARLSEQKANIEANLCRIEAAQEVKSSGYGKISLSKELQRLHKQKDDLEQVLESRIKKHISVGKLKSQNARAARVISDLSIQLVKMYGHRKKLERVCEKLKKGVLILQKEVKSKSKRSLNPIPEELSLVERPVAKSVPFDRASWSSFRDRNVPKRRTFWSNSLMTKQITALRDAVQCSPFMHETEHAKIIVRRPYGMETVWGEEHLFDTPYTLRHDAYALCADVCYPASVEVAAYIECDGSVFLLTGQSNVLHRKQNGEWVNYGNIDGREGVLGWIVCTTPTGAQHEYSLDEIMEGVMWYREEYCTSIVSSTQTENETNWADDIKNSLMEAIFSKYIIPIVILAICFKLAYYYES